MSSGFIDYLKLVLSDKYEISDSDYKTLSDILLSKGLSDDALDSGLVQIIYLMIKYNYRFPISLTFLKELWEYESISYNFVKMLSGILKNGVISLRKVKKETFYSSGNITKSDNEDKEQDVYIVVYGSKDFNEILSKFTDVLEHDSISEGLSVSAPKKVLGVVQKVSKMLKGLKCGVEIESYTDDSVTHIARLNLIISGTSNYSVSDSVIQKKVKKFVNQKYVKDVEVYKEDKDSLFFGVDIDTTENLYNGLAEGIYSFIENLEFEGEV